MIRGAVFEAWRSMYDGFAYSDYWQSISCYSNKEFLWYVRIASFPKVAEHFVSPLLSTGLLSNNNVWLTDGHF